jgi:hypothetical protein
MSFNEFETDSTKLFLDAVNILLQCIGESPLEDEEDISEVLEARIAAGVIVEAKKEILGDNWDFNRDEAYTLSPDTNGFIAVPANILDLSSSDGDLIVRGWKLYSKSNQTQEFEDAQDVDIVWDLPFNDLTHPIRNYITVSAARKFQARQVGDNFTYAYTKEDVIQARMIARRSDARTTKDNMYNGGYGSAYLKDGTI